MPIYEYKCQNCSHQFDLMQKMSEDPVKQCPECFQQSVVRMISAAGFQLKGSGWYQTDFKDKGKDKDKGKIKSDKASDSDSATNGTPRQSTGKKGDDN